MAAGTVRVHGLKETVRALDKVNRDAKRTVLAALAVTAEPVAADARQKISRYRGASINTIRPRASVRGVYVTQGAKKVTGNKPDFGRLQMREGLIPALEENEDKIVSGVEHALDVLAMSQGF